VDVGAGALVLSSLSVVPSCSGGSHVGSYGARPRGRCVAFGLYGFSQFINWPCGFRVCPLTYLCIGFRPVFLINWSLLFFFMKRQSSCRLLQKSRSSQLALVPNNYLKYMLNLTSKKRCPKIYYNSGSNFASPVMYSKDKINKQSCVTVYSLKLN
jgi:hypothetical protein